MQKKQNFFRSLLNALIGIKRAFLGHRNLKIMIVISILVVSAGFYFRITRYEWAVVFVCIGLVLTAEIINTSIEVLLDELHPNQNANIGKAKDLAAGAVLIACIISGISGLFLFGPYLFY